ncbi:phosphoribosyltransferase family protein [Anaeromyxobacter oryzisoli]|uniref:phosphoribosyltransferase family protein n=1 Tax=Anaeromyxobacter oryzisoli TaxID=2925408 RepID=UPI001F573A8E|nr:phosphoribosyltransferase family protein [Anaeromyxobacter sp. SG63]
MFRDREDGGRRLAARLERFRAERPIVLGLTRGGVPVALEVSHALGAPLEAIVVRKLGAPGCPEYAIGALAEGGAVYVRREALQEVGLDEAEVAALAEREAIEVARRVRIYRGDRPLPELAGRTVIVVDDGVATGATAHAAARAVRERGAARVVLAAPVIAAESVPELEQDFDEVVAVDLPEPFIAVGLWYERFGQVSDEEVLGCLDHERSPSAQADESLWNGEWNQPASADPSAAPGEETVAIPFDHSHAGPGALEADLVLPEGARGLVMFVHGSGSTRRSPRNRFVAGVLQAAGFGTLLFDLLTPGEAEEDEITGQLRFDIELLTARVVAATRWITALPLIRGLPLGYFGSSTGAAAALGAAAILPDHVAAVVSRGGRPDLVPGPTLALVRAPVLLVVGGRDETVLELNRSVLPYLGRAQLSVVPGATHLFEEPGTLGAVARLAADWFGRSCGPHVAGPSPAA